MTRLRPVSRYFRLPVILFQAIVTALVSLALALPEQMKIQEPFRKMAAVTYLSTGVAGAGLDSSKAAQFTAHTLDGAKNPNALYQAFLAIHYDEMDTVLTFHSAAGRTVSGKFPGDTNTFQSLSPFSLVRDSRVDSHSSVFTVRGGVDKMKIRQNIYAKKDSSFRIYLDYIFSFFPKTQPDTVRFSNVRILFGYDGDIGNTISGYQNDSCGYYADDSTKLVYVYDWPDTAKAMFTGVRLVKGGLSGNAGNKALFHQTVNAYGSSVQELDTLLYGMMTNPSFDTTVQNTDPMVYWVIPLGDRFTVNAADTLTDTIRFVWVNGFTKENMIRSAQGLKVSPPVTDPPYVKPSKTLLKNNYPNPFNASTKIEYDLSLEGRVTLIVYNALGQQVRVLADAWQKSGSYSVYWDGRDDKGGTVSGGLYFYRLKIGSYSLTKKCLIIK